MNALASKKLAISECLKSWGPLAAKVQEALDLETIKIEELTATPVHVADLDDLNCHVVKREAYRMVFMFIDELKEDLHPNEVSSNSEQ